MTEIVPKKKTFGLPGNDVRISSVKAKKCTIKTTKKTRGGMVEGGRGQSVSAGAKK